jgi:tetratricopeptide (TPR) repeat protein
MILPPLLAIHCFWRRRFETGLAWSWLLVGLAPPVFFPLIHIMADRYLYIPSLGFCWLLAIAIGNVDGRAFGFRRVVVVVLTIAIAGWYGNLAWNYTPAWRDSVSLWSYARNRSSAGVVAIGLSEALLSENRLDEAAQVLVETEVIGAQGENNLTLILGRQGRYREALESSNRALVELERGGVSPEDTFKLYELRGLVLVELGRHADAIQAWEEALRIRPGDPRVSESLHRARQRVERDSR